MHMKTQQHNQFNFALRLDRRLGMAFLGAGLLSLAACSGGSNGAAPSAHSMALSGRAMGGQQAVAGATVTVYQVGTGGYGTGRTSLASTTTDGSGNWNVTVSCPNNNPVYVVAAGGNAGSGTNAQLAMSVFLGGCTAASTQNNVNVNEVTTVATTYALSQFLDSTGQNMGTSSTNLTGLNNAGTIFGELASNSTGLAPTSLPTGVTGPTSTLYTLADVIATCVNSAGGVAGDATACGQFLTAATPSGGTAPTDTLQAAFNIARNPGTVNVAGLFGLLPPTPVFTPVLTAAPNDWTLALKYAPSDLDDTSAATKKGSYGLALDGNGNLFVSKYTGTSVFKLGPGGTELSPSGGYTASDMVSIWGISVDASNNVWLANNQSISSHEGGGGSVLEINNSGTELSPSGGFAPVGSGSTDLDGGVSALAFDATGNVYGVDYVNPNDQSRAGLFKLDSSGNVIQTNAVVDTGIKDPRSVALDNSGNIWITNLINPSTNNAHGAVQRVTQSGNTLTTHTVITLGSINGPYQIALDASGNAWVADVMTFGSSSGNGITRLNSAGTSGTFFNTEPTASSDGQTSPWAVAIDGSGNVWMAVQKNNNSPTGYNGSVQELTSAGALAVSGSYGYTGGGNVSNPSSIAIDSAGNVYVGNNNDNSLVLPSFSGSGFSTGVTMLVGAATPVKTPLIGQPALP